MKQCQYVKIKLIDKKVFKNYEFIADFKVPKKTLSYKAPLKVGEIWENLFSSAVSLKMAKAHPSFWNPKTFG